MRYSTEVKRMALEKLLRPDGPKVSELSTELGINERTLYGWLWKARKGAMKSNRNNPNAQEKLTLILEFRQLSEGERGQWLREKGRHEEDLKRWEKEITSALDDADGWKGREAELKKKLKETERDLRRKEKALAEMSALAMLKKKLETIWDDEEQRP